MSESASVRKTWSGGFSADLAITNTTNSVSDVSVIVEIDGSIRRGWGGGLIEDLGDGQYRVTFRDAAPGEALSAGIVVDGDPDSGISISPAGGVVDAPDPAPGAPVEDGSLQEVPSGAPGRDDTHEPGGNGDPDDGTDADDKPDNPASPVPNAPHEADDDSMIVVTEDITAKELQDLIDDSPAGTTIQLSDGVYDFDRTIEIGRDDISLLGTGSEKVTIRVPASLGQEAFRVGDGRESGNFRLTSSADEGDTRIRVSGNHTFEAGDFVYLSRESTNDFYDEIGDRTWRKDVDLRTSIVEIESVDANWITLSSGLHFDFDTRETTVREIDLLRGVELGGFTVDYGLDTADPSDFSNTLSDYDRNAVIEVDGTFGLVLADISAEDVPSLGVNVALSRELSASGLSMTGAHNKGDSGNGYALQVRDVYDSVFDKLNDLDMRHSVVFASWRSAAGNSVHVESTDRDINFHGGRDHDNVVMVDTSVRDAASDIIGPSVFVNDEGTHYGAPTDAGANVVKVGYAVGSRRQDDITGYDSGAWLDGAGGHDVLRGGDGDDVLIGGEGRDTLIGGAGHDIALYTGDLEDFRITDHASGALEVRDLVGRQFKDLVSDVEWLAFDNAVYRVSDGTVMGRDALEGTLPEPGFREQTPEGEKNAPAAPSAGDGETSNGGTGEGGRDPESGDDLVPPRERDESRGVDRAYGNGNSGDNLVKGGSGADAIWTRNGDDTIFGGSGEDSLHGGKGDDLLHAGGDADLMWGGGGSDVFRFDTTLQSSASRTDTIKDFAQGDLIDLHRIDANETLRGNQAFDWTEDACDGIGSLWFADGAIRGDTDGDGAADLVIRTNDYAFAESDFFL